MNSTVTNGRVTSADGTAIGYRRLGREGAPALILLHGSMMTSLSLMKLALALANDFSVYVPDRRGRGTSGPFGADYGLGKECQDLGALLQATQARIVFGLSSGAIISLFAALNLPIQKLALYEPPFTVDGSSHTGWLPRYEREVAAGKLASALVTIIKGTGDSSVVRSLPRFLSVPLFRLAIAADAQDAKADHVPLKALIPTMSFDAQLVAEAERAQETFRAVRADVLVLGGSKSAPYLRDSLDALMRRLPNAKRVELKGVGHLAAENGGRPELVADALRAFLGRA